MLLNACAIVGDTQQSYKRKADKAFKQQDYATALAYSQHLLAADSQRADALYLGGESARRLHDYDVAILYLERMPEGSKSGELADANYSLANAYLAKGEFDAAIVLYNQYLESGDTNARFIAKPQEELNYCTWAAKFSRKNGRNLVHHLGENINTAYADFAPLRFGDKIYFSSMYAHDSLQSPLTRIFSSIQGGQARLYEVNSNDKNLHTSHIALTADARRIFYTNCEKNAVTGQLQCAIYTREKQYEGHWGPPRKLPRHINLDTFNTTQPTVGYDKTLRKEVLYFSSNRPGGMGGMDIWGSILEKDGTYSEPFHLPFNTPEADITPFFHQPSQVLYFSSTGLESLGGLDVFYSERTATGWAIPENAGPPINSSYNDLYYTFHTGSGRAYFASNRPDRFSMDPFGDSESTDIYEAEITADLQVLAYSAVDSNELVGVSVELTDVGSGQTDAIASNPSGNEFSFTLQLEKNYRIKGSLDGYLPGMAEASTEGISSFKTLKRPLYLRPGLVLVVRTFHALDKTPVLGADVELIDHSTGRSFSCQNTVTGYQCYFPVEYGQEYHLSASKASFSKVHAHTSTIGLSRPDTIFQDLYLVPFTNLPLTLYFDNDKPGYGSWLDTITRLTYEQTYLGYVKRKPLFINEYTAGLSGSEKEMAEKEIRAFFENEVETGLTKLKAFCGWLADQLPLGYPIEILVAGQASPLASADYNRRLIGRRISSLENYLRQYEGGVLLPWIQSGSLSIKKDPRTSDGLMEGVSNDSTNRRLSEFSPAASRLRSVTISRVQVIHPTMGSSTK